MTPPSTLPRFKPQLLAPAGSWDCAKAAVENGADAIYFGLERFNARMRAQNFTEADLPELMAFLHRRGVKGYVTLNTLIFPQELPEAETYLRTIIAAGVDAAIVQDVGLCRLIRHLSPDFPIHASTQMTITSAAGVQFAQDLGCELVVLARECSIQEIHKIQAAQGMTVPLEVFVHGALCVAYSGQCLTSESLGGRSANRGECAQACRMPYDLIVDGELVDLSGPKHPRKYLLSPQDLAGLEVLPDLIETGITCLKIEGRLKTAEYVANVTRVYRQAIDQAMAQIDPDVDPDATGDRPPMSTVDSESHPSDRYQLEMAFSRGLYTGWFRGINNQALVHAEFGKKRGVYLGDVTGISKGQITLRSHAAIKPGDGVVFDNGHPEAREQGGRVYSVETRGINTVLTFGRQDIDLKRIQVGDRIWKTSDPDLDRQIRQSFAGDHPRYQRPITLEIHGEVGQPLVAIARDEQGHRVQVESNIPLVEAQNQPLTGDRLTEQLGRLGNTPFRLDRLTNHLTGSVMLPISELNRLRRDLVEQLESRRAQPLRWQLLPRSLPDLLPRTSPLVNLPSPTLIPLLRSLPQLQAALAMGWDTLYCELEDPRAYRVAVEWVQQHKVHPNQTIWVAPPRITKPGEDWILRQVRAANADGYLIRNYDQMQFFGSDAGENGAAARCIGDFSLNVANPLTADYFKPRFERLTASYDLNILQLEDLLRGCPSGWFEVTIHQHMPMFHMEHCVFCAFLSDGIDYRDCGRPCEQHEVKLRDRVGTEHLLRADAGCRNTVFNGTAQTGAEYIHRLLAVGARHFRVEFVHETPDQVIQTLRCYQQLLEGELNGAQLWRQLKLHNQLGVTRGPLVNSPTR